MATIKAIEASSVHQIQSGQVIVDLCSVAKELVENGFDAGATSIDVRFKNQGLDWIEVQDNGSGISPENYESLALKHYTSKLSTYADLTTLETFGFRGEALSSLCALSRFTVTTCLQADVPKGTRLEFETSGRLKGTSVVAAQKGTTVSIENLFQNLPVRRRELERNIKREWGKVIGLLNQYACIQTGTKFTVSQTPNKGKRIVLFSTKGNKTTRENIINVFGAKTMAALVALDLKLELEQTSGPTQKRSTQDDGGTREVLVKGYVSRPVHGEGRQTPDRQMFYVNSRPCGLPQFAKVFNEVYRSFNSSQSPFIFADIQLDTHLYDVNVSPDKRTILLHDQSRMLDSLRDSLTELFEKQDYTVPISQITPFKQTLKKTTFPRQETTEEQLPEVDPSKGTTMPAHGDEEQSEASDDDAGSAGIHRMKKLAAAKALARNAQVSDSTTRPSKTDLELQEGPNSTATKSPGPSTTNTTSNQAVRLGSSDVLGDSQTTDNGPDKMAETKITEATAESNPGEDDLLARLSKFKRSFLPESLQDELSDFEENKEASIPSIVRSVKPPDNAPLSTNAARPPKRPLQEVATITIGDHTVTSIIGTPSKRQRADSTAEDRRPSQRPSKTQTPAASLPSFGGRLARMFAAAAVKEQSSPDDELLHVNMEDSGDDAQHTDEDDSEAGMDSVEEEDGASDKSSPLFIDQQDVEQDEAGHPSVSKENEDEDALSPPSLQAEEDGLIDNGDGEPLEDEQEDDNSAHGNAQAEGKTESAEETGHKASEDNQKRTQAFLKGGPKGKYSTQSLLQRLKINEASLRQRLKSWEAQLNDKTSRRGQDSSRDEDLEDGLEAENAEEKLSLTIHKGDFGKMKIVGQFNLGFVLAVRPGSTSPTNTPSSTPPVPTRPTTKSVRADDELFIIDQHASDEKFNFERLQATTTVQSQRLVRPKPLELTALEEEIVIENQAALEKNGFVVSVDESGDEPVGSRCQLLSLPLSRETTFSLADLEELISLLGDDPTTTTTIPNGDGQGDGDESQQDSRSVRRHIPRPSKVRKMFAMRACRSSIMIGKALSHRQMQKVVRHMGEMEKPWNCPHGRPTMRHLCGLGATWDERGWKEGDCGGDGLDDEFSASVGRGTDWAGYVQQMKGVGAVD